MTDDYDYSDSFISDDDDDEPRYTKGTGGGRHGRKVGRGSQGGRGKGKNTLSRASGKTEPKVDGVMQRMLSAKNLKLNELRNQIEDMHTAFRDLKEENKLLKKMQHRQEKALVKYENTEGELPQIIARHQNEVRTLRENLRKTKEKYERTDRYLRDAEDELDKVKGKLKRYKGLADQNNLKERDELQRENQKLQIDMEEKEIRVKDLEKHVGNLNKNHRHELGIEIARNREMQKQLEQFREQNEQLERMLKEKDKELQIKNIYAQRARAPHRLPASYGGTPHDTPPPKARKRAPSLHELTPREKAKMYEEKRREDERKIKELRKDKGDGPRTAFIDSPRRNFQSYDDKSSRGSYKDYETYNSFSHTDKYDDYSTSNQYNPPVKRPPRGMKEYSSSSKENKPPVPPSGDRGFRFKFPGTYRAEKEFEDFQKFIEKQQQDKSRKEKEEKEREEMERRINQEREEKERKEWERRDRERREREERDRQEEERRKREEEDWKLVLERERLLREQETRDLEIQRREEKERKERQESERRERERQEQERRAQEERQRIEMDEKLKEERRKKDELLAKMKEIDEHKNTTNKPPEKKEVDTFFVTSGNLDLDDKESKSKTEDKTGKSKKKEKESNSFMFTSSRNDSDIKLGSASSKNSYSFSKPIENMHSGKPSHDDVTVPYIEKKKQQKQQDELLEFGGYQPSFSSSRTNNKTTTKKTGGIVFNDDFASSSKPPRKEKKKDLMADLFGDQAKTSQKRSDEDDIFKPVNTNKKNTNTSVNSSFPWDDTTTTTAKKPTANRENSTSALFGGGSALLDNDFQPKDSSKMLPRRPRQTTTAFHARPAVTAVDHYDDDIEEVIL